MFNLVYVIDHHLPKDFLRNEIYTAIDVQRIGFPRYSIMQTNVTQEHVTNNVTFNSHAGISLYEAKCKDLH